MRAADKKMEMSVMDEVDGFVSYLTGVGALV